jgi:hypothetical protein
MALVGEPIAELVALPDRGTAGEKVFVVTQTIDKDFAGAWMQAGTHWRDHVEIVRLPA